MGVTHGFCRPIVQDGQIWLIEHDAATALFPCDRAALGADVVLYDRVLASDVAAVLPAGVYAEILPSGAPLDGPAISPRALRLAADGWSVAQLVPTPGERRLRSASERLMAGGLAGDHPVQVIAKTRPDRCRGRDGCLRNLGALADELAEQDLLTLIFGPLARRYPVRGDAGAANGLAG